MALFSMQNPLVFTFGILGNLVAFLVYLAPASTFYRIFKKKSTEEFKVLPYVVALLSSMLWIYYALLKTNETLLITINSVGCFMETIYISIYLIYASRKTRISALRLIILLIVFGFGSIFLVTHFVVKEPRLRVEVLGWICVALSVIVYVAPLSIMKQVIRTKSVEFMPISLSFALLLNAVMWFFYGLLLKDIYIAIPNTVGFIFGLLQIILYLIYKYCKAPDHVDQDKLPTTVNPKTATVWEQIHPVPIPGDHNLEVAIVTVAGENCGDKAAVGPKQGSVGGD